MESKKICTISINLYDNGLLDIKAAYGTKQEDAMATVLANMISGTLPLSILDILYQKASSNQKKKSVEKVVKKFQEINTKVMQEIQAQSLHEYKNVPFVKPSECFVSIIGANKKGRRG